ncbi:hypothetical protein FKM82_014660 [Ascaphus truei]
MMLHSKTSANVFIYLNGQVCVLLICVLAYVYCTKDNSLCFKYLQALVPALNETTFNPINLSLHNAGWLVCRFWLVRGNRF